jgi:diguanylate cyclase (GGDEF)-like protein
VYLLLGQRVGALVTGLTVIGLALGNRHLQAPYSSNALATLLVGLVYLAVFFHSYVNQSLSYFRRMRALNSRLREAATQDPLTGLMNARAYHDGAQQALAQAQRAGQPSAVLFVDLDHFKAINDRHGHAAGDEVLRRVAAELRSRVRRSDWVGRIGGEEFSLFLPGAPLTEALRVAEQLRSGIEALSIDIDGGQTLAVTASIGVAPAERPGLSIAELLRQADAAMYLAKAAGRNRVSQLDGAEWVPGEGLPE